MSDPATAWAALAWRAGLSPGAPFLLDEAGRRLTFEGFRARCEEVAAGLAATGLGPGSTVAWQLPTSISTIVVSGALARLGVVQVPVLPIYRRRELGAILAQTRPAALLARPSQAEGDAPAEAARAAAEAGVPVRVVDGDLPGGDPATLPPPPAPASGGDVRWLYYTSGTTAGPKGARHSDAHVLAAARSLADVLDLGPDDVGTLVFPYAHVGGAFLLLSAVLAGHRLLVVERFSADCVPFLQREGATYPGSGLAFQRVYLEVQRRQPGVSIFPRARGFTHGGDAKRPHVHEALRTEIGGVGVLSNYGMTEVPMIASGSPHDPPEKLADRIGRVCPGMDVRIVGFDGALAAPGQEGEIRAKGPTVCDGYVDPSLDADAFDADGFFRTGDVGFLDADGYLEVTGRLKDIIIRKGENISAVEVEDLLHRHPAVAEVAVVGLPDEERGELCCAVVVPAEGHDGLELAEVTAFLAEAGLMVQKCPERLELRPGLPRDFFGKVKKADLRKELAG